MTNVLDVRVPQTAEEAVANGAQLLDERAPGWWRKIDLLSLDLSLCDVCVAGQLALTEYQSVILGGSEYPEWIEKSRDTSGGVDVGELYTNYIRCRLDLDLIEQDWTHGFCLPSARVVRKTWTYADLDAAWHEVIVNRLRADEAEAVVHMFAPAEEPANV